MTEKKPTNEEVKEFKPIKKQSPFTADPYNSRGQKGGKKGFGNAAAAPKIKSGKSISVPKFKGGSGGDR